MMHPFIVTLSFRVVLWMTSLLSPSTVAWGGEFKEVAESISQACEERPAFGSSEKCSAVLTAIAYKESAFDPEVCSRVPRRGDCDHGAAVGVFQINRSWKVPKDLLGQARLAAKLAEDSERICAGRPLAERLSWYAKGNVGCSDARSEEKSRARMRIAIELLKGGESK